ncbi:MAG TPA: M20 family metallopeptidase [Kiritimatiellia bacterium]|nr:M20 family metallopeptidase [Kiritimatiellia bacterium]
MTAISNNLNVIELAQKLVAIPSVNPVLTDDPAISGEHRMAEFLESFLDRRGFRVERHEGIRGRPNIVGIYGPQNPRKRLMIESHLDTQGIHGMSVPPFEGIIKDGRLYGRGACDMKGSMAAAMICLTPERLNELADAGVQLQFVGAIGEETGNLGAIELADMDIGADELVVLEPTDLHIVHAHKGAFWFEVEISGIAAHGSNPDKGISAIRGMSKVIELLYQQTNEVPLHNDLLGRATVNVGIIRGGNSINIVPERCVIEVDRRTLPGENSDDILSRIRASIVQLKQEGLILKGDVRRIKEGLPVETTSDSALIRRLGKACETQVDKVVCEGAAWYSDAGPFSRTCREVAVFGPGSIRQAHTADEYIELAELQKGADILDSFLILTAREAN